MNRQSTSTFVAVALLLVTGASSTAAAGDSEERPVGAFSKLVVGGGIDVYLTQSDEPRLTIEVEGVDLDDVVTEVVGDELRLSMKRAAGLTMFGGRDVKAHLDFVELTSITASGGSDIESRNRLRLEALEIDASGGSDVDLEIEAASLGFRLAGGSDLDVRGDAESVEIEASGGSDVSARSLDAGRVRIKVSGGSDAILRASHEVEIDARSGSDVVVYGNPAVKSIDNDRSSDVVLR
jgi:Putative auto-transporter adhesin, head GIN domain